MKKIILFKVFIILFLLFGLSIDLDKYDFEYKEAQSIDVFVFNNEKRLVRTTIKYFNNDVKSMIDVMKNKDEILPSNFTNSLPKDINLLYADKKDNSLNLHFSNKINDEQSYVALAYTFCKDNITEINIYDNNEFQRNISKNLAINPQTNIEDIKNITRTIIYYPVKEDGVLYYLPITKINNDVSSKVEIIINELKKNYIQSNLLSSLDASFNLSFYDILEEEVRLSFDNNLIAGLKESEIYEEIKYAMTYSIIDNYNVNKVSININ